MIFSSCPQVYVDWWKVSHFITLPSRLQSNWFSSCPQVYVDWWKVSHLITFPSHLQSDGFSFCPQVYVDWTLHAVPVFAWVSSELQIPPSVCKHDAEMLCIVLHSYQNSFSDTGPQDAKSKLNLTQSSHNLFMNVLIFLENGELDSLQLMDVDVAPEAAITGKNLLSYCDMKYDVLRHIRIGPWKSITWWSWFCHVLLVFISVDAALPSISLDTNDLFISVK